MQYTAQQIIEGLDNAPLGASLVQELIDSGDLDQIFRSFQQLKSQYSAERCIAAAIQSGVDAGIYIADKRRSAQDESTSDREDTWESVLHAAARTIAPATNTSTTDLLKKVDGQSVERALRATNWRAPEVSEAIDRLYEHRSVAYLAEKFKTTMHNVGLPYSLSVVLVEGIITGINIARTAANQRSPIDKPVL